MRDTRIVGGNRGFKTFAAGIRYKDHGIGLESTDKERLTEFFPKTRELSPDYSLQTDQLFVSGDHLIMQWTLHVTVTEPFYAGLVSRGRHTIFCSGDRAIESVAGSVA